MQNLVFILQDLKSNKTLVLKVFLTGFVVTATLFSYYFSMNSLILTTETFDQKSRARVLIEKIETYAATANQLSRSLNGHFTNTKMNQTEIENYLAESLQSGPMNLIYGVGVWFEPYAFDKNKKYFGPYVHRDLVNASKSKLTYEWNTEKYNYHNQSWYKQALMSGRDGIFVEPYFDTDLVYVTLASTFLNADKLIKGVISVDMILPQLQSLVEDVNKNEDEVIYVQSRDGYLLAHPLKSQFLKSSSFAKEKSLIDYKISDLKSALLQIGNSSDIFLYQENINQLGWKVVVESQKNYILRDSNRIFIFIMAGLFVFWMGLFYFLYLQIREKKIKKDIEKSERAHQAQLLQNSKLATLGEFSSGIAHEINNPLGIIYGKIDLWIHRVSNNNVSLENMRVDLEKIKSNAERISKIVRGLKTFSRDGGLDPFVKTSLKELFSDTFSISSEKIKSKNIVFETVEFSDISISCRPTQISQVLLNLINNSIDAIALQPNPWIKIEVVSYADHVKIFVTDSGLGISKEIAKKIMEPFFTTKEVGQGTGLGLSISFGIIASHNGLLSYNCDSKQTQFIVQLPYEQ